MTYISFAVSVTFFSIFFIIHTSIMTSRWVEVRGSHDDILNERAHGFTNKEVRKAFIRKVYLLLGIELLFLFGCCLLGAFLQPLRIFVFLHYWSSLGIMIGCFIASFIPYIALTCYEHVRKAVPGNYIIFNVFVLFISIGIMFATAMMEPWAFLAAFGITLALVIFLTLISFIPCLDVTGWGIWLFAIGFVVMMFGSISMILYIFLRIRLLILVYAGLSVLVACLYSSRN
ncbi:protein lifeguard 3-like isoform X2 [Atheta coriaria]|uniref:protein lifeguard 3-like isoform X2 n=1 Tax=Dalotia coriaria TaxID=877792 RepID=UPI0031F41747